MVLFLPFLLLVFLIHSSSASSRLCSDKCQELVGHDLAWIECCQRHLPAEVLEEVKGLMRKVQLGQHRQKREAQGSASPTNTAWKKRLSDSLRLGKRQMIDTMRLGKRSGGISLRDSNLLRLGKRSMDSLRLGKRFAGDSLRLGKRSFAGDSLRLGKRSMAGDSLRLGKRLDSLRLGKRFDSLRLGKRFVPAAENDVFYDIYSDYQDDESGVNKREAEEMSNTYYTTSNDWFTPA